MRESAVLHRGLNKPTSAFSGYDEFIRAGDKNIIDISAGAGVTCLGYSAERVKRAMVEQIAALPYVHSGNWTIHSTEKLADTLLRLTANHEDSLFKDGGVYFLNSGAEAVEAACKLAVQYHIERGLKMPRFFARKNSYHGNSLFTLELGDHPRKAFYQGVLENFYVHHFDSDEDAGINVLHNELDICRKRHIPAIVVIETIGGMTRGIAPPTSQYLQALRTLCKDYDAILIYDEVLCGNYRTGELFAWQYYSKMIQANLEPDIIVMGKGLTAGYFPLSAVIASKRIVDAIANGSGQLWHSSTNQNHPIGCAAGVAALAMYEQAKPKIAELAQKLTKLCIAGLPLSGVGTLRAMHFPGEIGHALRQRCMENGVAAYTDTNKINNEVWTFALVAPPYCVSDASLEEALKVLMCSQVLGEER